MGPPSGPLQAQRVKELVQQYKQQVSDKEDTAETVQEYVQYLHDHCSQDRAYKLRYAMVCAVVFPRAATSHLCATYEEVVDAVKELDLAPWGEEVPTFKELQQQYSRFGLNSTGKEYVHKSKPGTPAAAAGPAALLLGAGSADSEEGARGAGRGEPRALALAAPKATAPPDELLRFWREEVREMRGEGVMPLYVRTDFEVDEAGEEEEVAVLGVTKDGARYELVQGARDFEAAYGDLVLLRAEQQACKAAKSASAREVASAEAAAARAQAALAKVSAAALPRFLVSDHCCADEG